MVQFTLVANLDGFNRLLAWRDTFSTDLVREALALGRSDRSPMEALDRDVDVLLVLLSVNRVLDLSSVPSW